MNESALTLMRNGLSDTEKQALDDGDKYIATIQLLKGLKKLNPTLRRTIIDEITGALGKDDFLSSLNNYLDNK